MKERKKAPRRHRGGGYTPPKEPCKFCEAEKEAGHPICLGCGRVLIKE